MKQLEICISVSHQCIIISILTFGYFIRTVKYSTKGRGENSKLLVVTTFNFFLLYFFKVASVLHVEIGYLQTVVSFGTQNA